MTESALFQHFVHQLLPYYYVHFSTMGEDLDPIKPFVPKGVLTENLFDINYKVFYCLQDLIISSWNKSLAHSDVLIIKSPRLFVKYLLVFCLAKGHLIKSFWERFITVCASVMVIGTHVSYMNSKKFYKLTPRILIVLFEEVLKQDFKNQGGWKRLERYLIHKNYLEYYEAFRHFRLKPLQGIPPETIGKIIEFSNCRQYFYKSDVNVRIWENESMIIKLTSEVFLAIDHTLLIELFPLSEDQGASSPVDSATRRSSELTPSKSGKNLQADNFRVEDLAYDGFLQSHLLNFKKLSRSSQDPESSNSGESLDNALNNIRKSSKLVKQKMECALSILQSLSQ
ncbi:hypothetical protein TNCT_159481 [Trichonephila clavata]|uniref:Uncharacterized protein n=1 Tax=Trichonephila clavata TaxID=2740835 RepID=A0A8X6LVP1_TRICU|nr:hypothetical protein TNCT_159481 [Trichonephila clavata]